MADKNRMSVAFIGVSRRAAPARVGDPNFEVNRICLSFAKSRLGRGNLDRWQVKLIVGRDAATGWPFREVRISKSGGEFRLALRGARRAIRAGVPGRSPGRTLSRTDAPRLLEL